MTTRRQFVQDTLLATSGILAARREPVQADGVTFDLHTHPGAFFDPAKPVQSTGETVLGMNQARLTGTFVGIVSDAALLEIGPAGVKVRGEYTPGQAAAEYQRQLDELNRRLGTLPVVRATKVADLHRARETGRVATFLSCEGGECLEGQVERLDRIHQDGIRSLQLVHYVPSALGDLQTQPRQHGGLSDLGKQVVKRMNGLGMVVDVAHASFETVRDVASLTTAPIILSHSILAMEPDRPIAARAITPEHARLVAKTGGVIGAWPSGFNRSFEEFVDNTKRLIDLVGVDHVGLGTDMDGNYRPVFTGYRQLSEWGVGLASKGLSKAEVSQVLGGNVERVLKRVIG